MFELAGEEVDVGVVEAGGISLMGRSVSARRRRAEAMRQWRR